MRYHAGTILSYSLASHAPPEPSTVNYDGTALTHEQAYVDPSYTQDGAMDDEFDLPGTETDTWSDNLEEPMDWSDLAGYDPEEQEEWLYFQKRYHNRRWRRYRGKPPQGMPIHS